MPRIQHTYTTMCCFRGLREGIRLSANPSNIDIIARTRNRRFARRNPERHIHRQLSDSTFTQRECENQDQERVRRGGGAPSHLGSSRQHWLTWENKGVKIDGEFLSNLRFADDIFLCTETPHELQHMLQELSDESRRMGLEINTTQRQM